MYRFIVLKLLREGGMVPLLACMKTAGPLPKTAKEALRALGAAAQHKSFGIVLMKTQGAVRAAQQFHLPSYSSIFFLVCCLYLE